VGPTIGLSVGRGNGSWRFGAYPAGSADRVGSAWAAPGVLSQCGRWQANELTEAATKIATKIMANPETAPTAAARHGRPVAANLEASSALTETPPPMITPRKTEDPTHWARVPVEPNSQSGLAAACQNSRAAAAPTVVPRTTAARRASRRESRLQMNPATIGAASQIGTTTAHPKAARSNGPM
jgi:hypothetical protein